MPTSTATPPKHGFEAGVTTKDNRTWDEVAAAAAKLDGAEPGMKGICLRGLPGWGEVFVPLTTVGNTFGVIAGKKSVDDALNNGQKLAEQVSKKYQGR